MFIGNNRGCNQMVSDADTLLLYITLLISLPQRGHIDLSSTEVETKNRSTPPLPVLLKGFLRVRAGSASQLLLLFISPHIASPAGRQSVRVGEES